MIIQESGELSENTRSSIISSLKCIQSHHLPLSFFATLPPNKVLIGKIFEMQRYRIYIRSNLITAVPTFLGPMPINNDSLSRLNCLVGDDTAGEGFRESFGPLGVPAKGRCVPFVLSIEAAPSPISSSSLSRVLHLTHKRQIRIKSKIEAKVAAKKIFQNVARHGCKLPLILLLLDEERETFIHILTSCASLFSSFCETTNATQSRQASPETIMHDPPNIVDKIQELLLEKEVHLNAKDNNLDNPIRDETATDEDKNHNLPFSQPKLLKVLVPKRGNTENGD
ncbi:hypothetical protein Fmac_026461 [Flemingia macrophylla]|uniref:Maturase K n=1 Tax=Flemingia macrophylla TaxID=520843 RepID=A0ABD1LF36_9FABA